MATLKNLIRKLIGNMVGGWEREFKYMTGQSAIIASRQNFGTFQHLWDAEVKVYSQFGEDGILDYLCEKLSLSKPKIIEIGAGNFTECNSRWMCEFRNASAFCVDGREDLGVGIRNSKLLWKTHLFHRQDWVTPDNVQEIIDTAHKTLAGLDIFSLDLDGNDYWILKNADLKNVKLVIVEYNPLFGHTNEVTIPRNDSFSRSSSHHSWLYFGASLKAFTSLLSTKDFAFVGTNRVGNNAFFVKNDLRRNIPLEPQSDYSIYTDWPIRDSRSASGALNYLAGRDRIEVMEDMPLLELVSNRSIRLGDASK